MRRKILLTGLTLALFVAGFLAATWPAVAELRTITITLVGGQQIVTTVDVPPGTPASQIKLPEISAPIAGITDGTRKPTPQKQDGATGPSGATGPTGGSGNHNGTKNRKQPRNATGKFLNETNTQP